MAQDIFLDFLNDIRIPGMIFRLFLKPPWKKEFRVELPCARWGMRGPISSLYMSSWGSIASLK